MSQEKIAEINEKIEQLKKNNPVILEWIEVKQKLEKLEDELSIDSDNDELHEEHEKLEENMKFMKSAYSSIMMYEQLLTSK